MSVLFCILIGTLAAAVLGVLLYTNEVLQGRVHRFTVWNELTPDQWFSVLLMLGGGATFLFTLITCSILKV